MYDAADGKMTTVAEGDVISIQPNDYGRYYLTTHSSMDVTTDNEVGSIIISVRQHTVTVTYAIGLDAVTVTSPDGTRNNAYSGGGTTAQFTLQPGTYIIDAMSGQESKTTKVVVR